jgi:filamentous hemagglutinin family protein
MKAHNLYNFVKKILFIYSLTIGVELQKNANAQIVPDNTLGGEISTVTPNTNIKGINSDLIGGGAVRGANLFHSFLQFNVAEDQGVYFQNPQGARNILTRVTGSNTSKIMGILGVFGDANLFLLNPNGIIFGPNSSLDVNGSFLVTTANSIRFDNQGFFDSSTPSSPPLLTINPSGFLFTREKISPIINRSSKIVGTRINTDPSATNPIVNLRGLKVPDGQSLIFLGGDIIIDDGGLYALGGQVEVVSASGPGLVGLSYNDTNLNLSFPQDMARGNISFSRGARVDTSGNGSSGGNVQVIGKNIQLKDKSQIISTTSGQKNGGTLFLNATDILELIGPLPSGGIISTLTSGSGSAGNIKITARKLLVSQGAQIISSTVANGNGGDISINTTESVELKDFFSGIFSATAAEGVGGDISISTPGNLVVSDGAIIASGAGSLELPNGIVLPATGDGGNILIRADNSVQINGGFLFAGHDIGKAGNINIDTKFLNIQNGSVFVSSSQGQAGNLTINANSLALDGGVLSADTAVSGANITLTISDILRMGNESQITAIARGSADGGNITIDTGVLLALPPTGSNGSDIKATAEGGNGGNIKITAQGIFGIEERDAPEGNQTNDIDASSQFGRSGQVDINTAIDPKNGLTELPETVIDPDTQVAQNPCNRGWGNELTVSGRGGLPPSPRQDLSSEATQIKLVEPVQASNGTPNNPVTQEKTSSLNSVPEAIIAPAQGWVYNKKGQVVLVAYDPTITGAQRLKVSPAGCPVP